MWLRQEAASSRALASFNSSWRQRETRSDTPPALLSPSHCPDTAQRDETFFEGKPGDESSLGSAAACADGVKRGVEGLRDRLDDVLELRSTGVNLRAGVLLTSVDLIDHVLDAVDPSGGAEESIVDRVDLLFEAETRADKLDVSLPLRVRRRTEVAHERLGGEPSRSFDESDARRIAAPGPLLGTFAEARAYRIERDVTRDDEAVRLLLDEDVLEALFEQMPSAAMPLVEALGIARQKAVHARGKGAFGRADRKVVVIAHQTVVMKDPAGAGDLFGEKTEEEPAIFIVTKDGDAVVTT